MNPSCNTIYREVDRSIDDEEYPRRCVHVVDASGVPVDPSERGDCSPIPCVVTFMTTSWTGTTRLPPVKGKVEGCPSTPGAAAIRIVATRSSNCSPTVCPDQSSISMSWDVDDSGCWRAGDSSSVGKGGVNGSPTPIHHGLSLLYSFRDTSICMR